MCELFAMSSRYPATVRLSLEEFARHGGLTGPNRDGWGIGYYEDRDVRLMKEPEAAADSDFVRFIEGHDLRSTIVVSHIRRATQGPPALCNTQPFCRELGARMHMFAHNGDLPAVSEHPRIQLGRFRPIGETDSEYMFCSLLHRLEPLWSNDGIPSLDARMGIIGEVARAVRELGPANFIYSDGDVLFVHGDKRKPVPDEVARPPGLHVLRRTCLAEEDQILAKGLTVQSEAAQQDVVLIASVPLTTEDWAPLGEGEILALARGKIVNRDTPRREE